MKRRILIVEDDLESGYLFKYLLIKAGVDVVHVTDGRSALEEVANWLPDLVLLDIGLPDIDGFEVLKQLRAYEETRSVPVVVVSAHVMPNERQEVLNREISGFVEKPVDITTLLETIRAVIPLECEKDESPDCR